MASTLPGLAEALARSVSSRTRAKGEDYFHSNAVRSFEAFPDRVEATVMGARPYHVTLSRDDEGYEGSCECPYFEDRLEICKHIWAVVLHADREGALPPTSPASWLDVPAEADDYDFDEELSRAATRPVQRVAPRAERWEQFLQQVSRKFDTPAPARAPARFRDAELIYAVSPDLAWASTAVPILMLARQRKKNGEWTQPQMATIRHQDVGGLPDAEDREILTLLLGAPDPYGMIAGQPAATSSSFALVPPLLESLLPRIGRTGRLHLRTYAAGRYDLVPLTWDDGEPWTFEVDVKTDDDDQFVVDGALVRGDERLRLDEAAVLFQAGYLVAVGRLARFDHRDAYDLLMELRRAGAMRVPRRAAASLMEGLARFAIDPATLPQELRYDVIEAAPRPRANVTRAKESYPSQADLRVVVEFDYDGTQVPANGRGTHYDLERGRLIRRSVDAEAQALAQLQPLGIRRPWPDSGGLFSVSVTGFPRAVRTLVAEGWHVEAEGRVFRPPQAMKTHVASGVDWFELHGSVDFGDGQSASIADLLASLKRGDATIVLGDGTRGMVPDEWLRKYLRIANFGEESGDHVRFRPTQAALLDALLEQQPAISVDETFARAREALRAFDGVRPLDPPSSFKGTLREYQREALGWFDFLRRFGFGGCLADDMGLGKTVMVLALLEARRASGEHDGLPSLAVVPRSLVFNWRDEATRFAPELRVLDYTGTTRDAAAIANHDLVLTTYGTLRRDAPELTAQGFDYVILDEAQAIKNASTAAAKASRLLRGRHRLALSGTPIENHVGELWSLFEFLNPGLLGTSSAFKKASAITRADGEDLAVVTRAVKPMILRRTKAQVEPELPARTEQTIVCELEAPQRKFYDKLRDHYRSTLLARVARGGLARSKMHVLEALLRLRQAACHPGLVDPSKAQDSSAKIDALLPQLQEVTGEAHKALVFSQFTSFLAIVRDRLDRAGIVYEYLDGKTVDRAERVERFNTDPGCRVFLISLKAGGVGLNLTAAEYVFLLDPWWNPAAEAQAIDRAHRIGQERHVFAYRLLARDTIEEKVAELQRQKRQVADAILSADPALIRTLSVEDLEWLLQ